MFFRLFAIFALVAAAFATPEPKPQFTYAAAPGVLPLTYSAYSPVSYSAYSAPYAAAPALPYAYSGYYVR